MTVTVKTKEVVVLQSKGGCTSGMSLRISNYYFEHLSDSKVR